MEKGVTAVTPARYPMFGEYRTALSDGHELVARWNRSRLWWTVEQAVRHSREWWPTIPPARFVPRSYVLMVMRGDSPQWEPKWEPMVAVESWRYLVKRWREG